MKTQPRQYISNKYNTCTVITSPVHIGSKTASSLPRQWQNPDIWEQKSQLNANDWFLCIDNKKIIHLHTYIIKFIKIAGESSLDAR